MFRTTSAGTHNAYVSTQNRGYGRYTHTVACSCGSQLGTYNNHGTADRVARKHEKTGR